MGTPGKEVSKKDPCPICSKGDWCLQLGDGITYNCKRVEKAPDGWREVHPAKDGTKIFRPIEEQWQKPRRKAQVRQWNYHNTDGKATVQVHRKDDDRGNKKIWQTSLIAGKKPRQLLSQVMPYRYQECLERAKRGERIFWVEGETCADALWDIGIPATTTIRGSKGYNSEQHVKLFPTGSIVICPDRDKPGLEYANAIAQDYPEAQWLYAFPDSSLWQRLNDSGGADIGDWIESGVTAEQIHAAVGPRRNYGELQSKPRQNKGKVVALPTAAPLDIEGLGSAISELIAQDLEGSDLALRLTGLADEFHKPHNQIEKIYYQRRKEVERSEQVKDAATGLNTLQQVKQSTLPIEAGLYGDGGLLAWQLRSMAEAMPTAPEFLVTTLIPVLASRLGTTQTLVISPRAGYKARPIFRTMIVAETGRKKTPAQKAIIGAFHELESIYYQTYKQQLENYEQELSAWKRNSDGEEPKPSPPVRKRYVSTDDTPAARIQIHAENPRGLCLYRDEGSLFSTERGRYNSGKGDGGETEADLSEFNGGALSKDRKGDGSTFLEKTGISRTGAIQYAKLKDLMGSHQDDCGEWARYLFCTADAPPSYLDLTGDDSDVGLQKTLIDLIQCLDELPERDYLLSYEAKTAFMGYQHLLTDRAMETDHPAMGAALPKFETYFGRFCLLLHVVNAVLAGEQPAATVDAHTVEIARQWTEYFYGQFQLLMALNSPQQELTGKLLTLRDYIARKDGITTADLTRAKKGKKVELLPMLTTLVEQGFIHEQDGKYFAGEQPTQQTETIAKPEADKSEAPGETPVTPITVNTQVEVIYPSGEAPPPETPPPGTKGTVTAINDDNITILIPPPPDKPETPLGQLFKTVPCHVVKALPALAS
ncbi:DUF3987 domain-containing protein [Leptothoe kymatousa]|uniref:DUF3987 domain-containing protein n=1 Tax=Leptothoe kymatousa TAU-MAC 1615 TaxID=2364775 RepID=A0ABS5Y3Z5_9CYAN|nr:DUF3987 domain-containing protein [Leptothoe kymatousa]MBT9312563.1 DUF3987 domain-containing protein [Leptothoe kymatousa TAU-MAC 1615]